MPKMIDFPRLRDVTSAKRTVEQLDEARQEIARLKRRLLEAETLALDARRIVGWIAHQAGGKIVVTVATLNATCSPDFHVTRTLAGDAIITAEKAKP